MTLNDPIVVWVAGAVVAAAGWFARRQDRRITDLEADIEKLHASVATLGASKETLDRMYTELQELTKLTNRIAGHLNLN